MGAFALLAFAVGCAKAPQTENLLSAVGFRTIVASDPQQQQRLKTLPPNKVTWVQRNGKAYCVYADSAHNPIYVGKPSPYQPYQQLRLASKPAQENLEAAELNQEAPLHGGVWGPWYF